MPTKIKPVKKASLIKPKVTPPSIKEKQKHNDDSGKGKTNGIERYYGKIAIDKGDLKAKKLFATQEEKMEEGKENNDLDRENNTREGEIEEKKELENELKKRKVNYKKMKMKF